ncbi:MAG: TetR/AcrR family transcriptional regulator [Actinobacteria bacterium]|nr:TetR/AcrR family transcriptional regulator [Actinomycetota bacterium]
MTDPGTGDESDTRIRMITAAEQLFGERGIGAVSLREVGVAAGQRNNSAVQYHFGSKAGLIDAILELRMATIDTRRQAMLADLDAAGRAADLRALVEALVRPLAEAVVEERPGESWYARFLAQTLTTGGDLESSPAVKGGSVPEVYRRLERVLRTEVPRSVLEPRLWLAGTYFVNALAGWERVAATGAHHESGLDLPGDVFVDDLIDTTVGLLQAASVRNSSSTATRRRPRASTTRLARRGASTTEGER